MFICFNESNILWTARNYRSSLSHWPVWSILWCTVPHIRINGATSGQPPPTHVTTYTRTTYISLNFITSQNEKITLSSQCSVAEAASCPLHKTCPAVMNKMFRHCILTNYGTLPKLLNFYEPNVFIDQMEISHKNIGFEK